MMLLRQGARIGALVMTGALAGTLSSATAQDSAKGEPIVAARYADTPSASKLHRKSVKHPADKQALPTEKPAETPSKPETLAGPPLSPDRATVSQQVHHLLQSVQAGKITLLHPPRESEQLHCLELSGVYLWPPPPAPAAAKSGKTVTKRDANTRAAKPLSNLTAEKPSAPLASAANSIVSILPGGRITDTAPSRQSPPDFRISGGGIESGLAAIAPSPAKESASVSTPPSPALFHMLNTLAVHSTPAHPLELMSLLRPPYQTAVFRHAGPRNPHSLGLAADIGAYAGHRIRQDDPEDSVAMVLAMLRDLPPGRYRMGVPKAPETPLVVGQSPAAASLAAILAELAPDEPQNFLFQTAPVSASALPSLPSRARRRQNAAVPEPSETEPEIKDLHPLLPIAAGLYAGLPRFAWPFFPPPEPELENGLIAPLRQSGRVVLDSAGRPQPHIIRFRNESYAPADGLGDVRVRKALEAARKRGADVFALFPDGPDHIHIDVRQQP